MLSRFGSLQMFAPDVGTGGGGEVPPAVDTVDMVDPVTGKTMKVPKEFSILLGHNIERARKDADKKADEKYKPILGELEKEKADFVVVKAELDKIKELSMTAEQRAETNAKKVIEEHEKKRVLAEKRAETGWGLYFDTVKKNDIYSAFGNTKLNDPEGTAIQFEYQGRAKVEQVIDSSGKPIENRYETRVTLEFADEKGNIETIEGRAQDLFKRWIEQPRNSHHIQNDLSAGGGSRPQGGAGGKVDYSDCSPTEKLTRARQGK
jgi:hypothetical protein